MNDLQVFGFEGRSVRVVEKDGNPWWVAKDVAEVLDIRWDGARTISHVPEEWRGSTLTTTPSGSQEMVTLSEQGLYFFICRSDKPKALEFQKWIAGEVIPSIRKTGSYGVTLNNPPTDVRLREVNKAVRMGVLSAKEGKAVLLTPASIPDRLSGMVREKRVPLVQTPIIPAVPALDTFLSLPDFSGWREKLDENPGCFEKMGVKVIRKAGREELAIDHNHKILLRAAGRDYKARLKTDPRYIETRQVHINRRQFSALIFDWKKLGGK